MESGARNVLVRMMGGCFMTVIIVFLMIHTQTPMNHTKHIMTFVPQESVSNVASTPIARKIHRPPGGILIGVRKGGTGAIIRFLSMNPNIQTYPGELGFFLNNGTYNKGINWYSQQMPLTAKDEISFEKTPDYFAGPLVPRRIWDFNSEQKMIIAIRDPVRRLVSEHYFHHCRAAKGLSQQYIRKYGDLTFDEILVNQETGEVATDYDPLKRSMYYDIFKEWLSYFPLNQFLIVDGDEFINNNPAVAIRLVENFLGVPNYIRDDMFVFDAGKGFYCPKETGCIEGKGHIHPEPTNITLSALTAYFRPHNKLFFELIGRNFDWM